MMSGGGGYLLSGIFVDDTDPDGLKNGSQKAEGHERKRQKTDS